MEQSDIIDRLQEKVSDLGQLERMKELCKERNNLYEKQNDLKEQKHKLERSLKR